MEVRMDYDAFVSVVQTTLDNDRETAEFAARSVLSVLGERIGADEGVVYVSYLPAELAPWLHTPGGAKSFDAAEFVRRITEREQSDAGSAERHAIAVLAGLARALPDKEYDHLVVRLSRDYAPLLPKGPMHPTMSTWTFLETIAQRAGIELSDALPVAQAVLETLAERIADEAIDLTTRVPVPVHAALKRGVAQADTQTERMSPEDFVHRVAQRAGVSEERAVEYTKAVLATVRDATREEFLDVTLQLPDGYRPLLGVG
jgi:uncharacterized protein (DUF2267 family)